MNTLDKFRKKFLFLNFIPDNIYFNLCSDELIIPDNYVNTLRKELEAKLDAYVMTYNRKMYIKEIPHNKHLCFCIKGAVLNKKQIDILNTYEEKVINSDISFVVYQKPIQLL